MAIDVRKLLDIYNSHDVDKFDAVLADDCVLVRNGVEARGKDEMKKVLERLYRAMPDIEYRLDDVVVAGNKMVLRWSGRGTHKGEYLGVPPTNKAVSYDGITIYELAGDRIARIWVTANLAGFMRATGTRLQAPPPAARA